MPSDLEAPQYWSRLDRWLEPPGRALLAWLVLAGMMGDMGHAGVARHLGHAIDFMTSRMNAAGALRLPPVFQERLFLINLIPLLIWYQPPLLRLGRLRWLIWVAGAVFTVAAIDYTEVFPYPWNALWIETARSRAVDELNRPLPAPLWLNLLHLATLLNLVGLWVWYRPIVSRLGRVRWLVWLGGAVIAEVAVFWLSPGANLGEWTMPLMLWCWPAFAGFLIIGRRSQPWYSLPAGALSLIATFYFRRLAVDGDSWWWLPASNLPYAAIMLYGTRPLPRRDEDGEGPERTLGKETAERVRRAAE